eukprot:TRINITY_DN35387_c0_g1_i1.p1 TRINITY_DN35387_c0_g1~~TRINITY_DN35387_c0_g1_i1.p1  ORF type:complete len:519 (+),score=83.67 TRINITY_DN35387_c0_g1_i1:62-1618(+)
MNSTEWAHQSLTPIRALTPGPGRGTPRNGATSPAFRATTPRLAGPAAAVNPGGATAQRAVTPRLNQVRAETPRIGTGQRSRLAVDGLRSATPQPQKNSRSATPRPQEQEDLLSALQGHSCLSANTPVTQPPKEFLAATPTPRSPAPSALKSPMPKSPKSTKGKAKSVSDGQQSDFGFSQAAPSDDDNEPEAVRKEKKLLAAQQAAALQQRGSIAAKDLEDAERLYDPKAEKKWGQKYKFFSELKMKGTYRTYARARHDPFNKDPSWGIWVLSNIAKHCKKKGIMIESLFQNADLTGDSSLSRAELKRALVPIMPKLSDMEMTAIFDVIDVDKSGDVTIEEFYEAVNKCKDKSVPAEKAERWRNPIHRFKRLPPGIMEGWDHLKDEVKIKATRAQMEPDIPLQEFCDKETNHVMKRLSKLLAQNSKALKHEHDLSKHYYFGGGADTNRFRWQEHGRAKQGSAEAAYLEAITQNTVPDPGGVDVRPGFLIEPVRRQQLADALEKQGYPQLHPNTKVHVGR